MFVVAGLGNPGKKYENTRHNIGFELIDYIARDRGVAVKTLKHKGLLGEFNLAGEKLVLLKPQTYMNLSGDCILSVMNYYKLPVNKLFVVYDDIDIDLGALRIRKSGSAGTHNGMRDIIYKLKSDDFPRFRIGIGSPTRMDLKNFVLSGYSKDEVVLMESAVKTCANAIYSAVEFGVDSAMNEYNTRKKAQSE